MTTENGLRAQATQQEGRQGQAESREDWRSQPEAHKAFGSKRQRIVKLENSAQHHEPFVIQASTTEEVIAALCRRIPNLDLTQIGLVISPQREGATNRQLLEGNLPDDVQDIWVKLYLKKHRTVG